MNEHAVKQEIAKADKVTNNRDFDTVANCYMEDAVLVVKSGTLAQGREAIKIALQEISDYFSNSLKVSQGDMVVIEAGDTVQGYRWSTTKRHLFRFSRQSSRDQWRYLIRRPS